MPSPLVRRIALCLALALPAVVFRLTGFAPDPVVDLVVFGGAVVAASFMLAWAAEATQKDISGALAIAILALIAVLPEYAVDLYYAFRSGSDASYEQFAAANMTGSNRLLLGFGWPLVVFVALFAARRAAQAAASTRTRPHAHASRRPRPRPAGLRPARTLPRALHLPGSSRLDIGVLAIVSVLAFVIPLSGRIAIWFGLVLIAIFAAYLWRAGRAHDDDSGEEFVGTAAHLAGMPRTRRRMTVGALFVGSAAIILSSAEPFATALVHSGSSFGVDSYYLVQWLAPLASEAPEFIVAVLFALRGMGAAAIGTLIASKINQWTLLVGSLPIAHFAGGGGTDLALDPRQIEEFVLTASQTVMGVAIIVSLRFHRWSAVALVALFALQFIVTDTTGRYILSAVHLIVAAVALWIHRSNIVPTLAAPFRRSIAPAVREPDEPSRPQTNFVK